VCVEYHVCKSRTASPIKGGWGVVGVRDKGKKPIPYNCQKKPLLPSPAPAAAVSLSHPARSRRLFDQSCPASPPCR